MERKPWKLDLGTLTIDVTLWNLHHASFLLDCTPWKLPQKLTQWEFLHGTYTIEAT